MVPALMPAVGWDVKDPDAVEIEMLEEDWAFGVASAVAFSSAVQVTADTMGSLHEPFVTEGKSPNSNEAFAAFFAVGKSLNKSPMVIIYYIAVKQIDNTNEIIGSYENNYTVLYNTAHDQGS